MTKKEYLEQVKGIDTLPLLFFYYQLKGGKIGNIILFGMLFFKYVTSYNINLGEIIYDVTLELNDYFKI